MNKKTLCTLLIAGVLFACLSGIIFAEDYVYYGTVMPVNPARSLGGVALKPNGDIYYVTFANPDSALGYISNAIPGCLTSTYSADIITTESAFTDGGRGLNDVELDADGNIYISGTGATAASTVLKKFSAAPAHAQVWTSNDIRHNGIAIISADVLAIAEAWNRISWKKTSDGTAEGTAFVSGGTSYGRSLAFNSQNNDIYVGRNGDNKLSALKVFSGGSSSNLSGYALALDEQLPTLGVQTAFGVATQALDYDEINNQLIAADVQDQGSIDLLQGVRIYDITGTGATTVFTQAQYFDGTAIPGRTLQYLNVYGVSYAQIGGVDYIAIGASTGTEFVIDILSRGGASVGTWDLY